MPWHFPARCEPQIEFYYGWSLHAIRRVFSRDPENLQRLQVWAAAFVRHRFSESDEAYEVFASLSLQEQDSKRRTGRLVTARSNARPAHKPAPSITFLGITEGLSLCASCTLTSHEGVLLMRQPCRFADVWRWRIHSARAPTLNPTLTRRRIQTQPHMPDGYGSTTSRCSRTSMLLSGSVEHLQLPVFLSRHHHPSWHAAASASLTLPSRIVRLRHETSRPHPMIRLHIATVTGSWS
jgi:hypothetical protein